MERNVEIVDKPWAYCQTDDPAIGIPLDVANIMRAYALAEAGY